MNMSSMRKVLLYALATVGAAAIQLADGAVALARGVEDVNALSLREYAAGGRVRIIWSGL